ncbi:Gfo/Idh/MocA family protein [Labrys okinawensis]|uniref:Gfo/Idh/MocA family protein n=1 Tax=Labrys okinawensis TaxID=346911 RepID=UPI0039BCCE8C
MSTVQFAIIGSGWRTLFFLRIARALPEKFRVTGILTRDGAKAEKLQAEWGVPAFTDFGAMIRHQRPDFVVVSVAQPAAPTMIELVASAGLPIMTETPPAQTLEGLLRLWALVEKGAHIEVAEQYIYQPLHQARLALIRAGRLGQVSFAHVSHAHGYHGTSLIRHYLDAGFAEPAIRGRAFSSTIVAGPNRQGPPAEHRIDTVRQVIAELDFGDRLGIFDFAGSQYFSWVRAYRLTVRGEKGEIVDRDVRYLKDFLTPVELTLRRSDTGQYNNHEGYFHRGIQAGEDWVYRNPYPGAALTDDEIAVAAILDGMGESVRGGKPIYSFAEAAQDQYLSLLIEEAVAAGTTVQAVRQPWAV